MVLDDSSDSLSDGPSRKRPLEGDGLPVTSTHRDVDPAGKQQADAATQQTMGVALPPPPPQRDGDTPAASTSIEFRGAGSRVASAGGGKKTRYVVPAGLVVGVPFGLPVDRMMRVEASARKVCHALPSF